MTDQIVDPGLGGHGAGALPAVTLDSFNIEIRDDDGFIGDRASKGAFVDALENWRERLRALGEDPLGEESDIGRKKLEKILFEGAPEAAGVVIGAIEDFSQAFARVIQRYLKTKAWRDTERIAVGGGFRESRLGELVIGRTAVILRAGGKDVELTPIHNHPDEAGLIGALHLAPAWIFTGHDSLIGIDIGGTNIRVGIVTPNLKKSPDLSAATIWKSELWRHRDDEPSREQAVKRIIEMIEKLAADAGKEGLKLAPFIGIGCPGVIEEDGSIDRGAQNLPGNWHAKDFNLPALLREALPTIGDHETTVLMHNDAVVQGLSEVPFMRDHEHWGVLTIGTGLGNARFTNRPPAVEKNGKKAGKNGAKRK